MWTCSGVYMIVIARFVLNICDTVVMSMFIVSTYGLLGSDILISSLTWFCIVLWHICLFIQLLVIVHLLKLFDIRKLAIFWEMLLLWFWLVSMDLDMRYDNTESPVGLRWECESIRKTYAISCGIHRVICDMNNFLYNSVLESII